MRPRATGSPVQAAQSPARARGPASRVAPRARRRAPPTRRRFRPPPAQAARRPSPAAHAQAGPGRRSAGRCSHCAPPSRPVGAGLLAVAAELHRAPAAGAVLRVVVEGPLAVATDLQPRPGPVEHRRQCHLPSPGRAHPSRRERRRSRVVRPRPMFAPPGRRPDRLGCGSADVVDVEKPAQRVAKLACACSRRDGKVVLLEPRRQPLMAVFAVGRVDEQLDAAKWLGRRVGQVVVRQCDTVISRTPVSGKRG